MLDAHFFTLSVVKSCGYMAIVFLWPPSVVPHVPCVYGRACVCVFVFVCAVCTHSLPPQTYINSVSFNLSQRDFLSSQITLISAFIYVVAYKITLIREPTIVNNKLHIVLQLKDGGLYFKRSSKTLRVRFMSSPLSSTFIKVHFVTMVKHLPFAKYYCIAFHTKCLDTNQHSSLDLTSVRRSISMNSYWFLNL